MGLLGKSFHSEYMPQGESCGWCKNLNIYDARGLKAYCRLKRTYYPINDRICSKRNYERDLTRTYDQLKEFLTYHVSTAVCTVLGMDNNSLTFQSIKKLRDIVEASGEHKDLIALYDVYGPVIVSHIAYDSNRVEVCRDLLINYISKVAILVAEENIEDAVNLYKEMIESLYKRYIDEDMVLSNLINKSIFDNTSLVTSILVKGK